MCSLLLLYPPRLVPLKGAPIWCTHAYMLFSRLRYGMSLYLPLLLPYPPRLVPVKGAPLRDWFLDERLHGFSPHRLLRVLPGPDAARLGEADPDAGPRARSAA